MSDDKFDLSKCEVRVNGKLVGNGGDWRTVNAHGRTVTLNVSDMLDEFAQFRVGVSVDGKERWHAFFNDESDE